MTQALSTGYSSPSRKRGSRATPVALAPWIPAFAGMTINLLIFRHSFVVGHKGITERHAAENEAGDNMGQDEAGISQCDLRKFDRTARPHEFNPVEYGGEPHGNGEFGVVAAHIGVDEYVRWRYQRPAIVAL
jgi:hypothetical protein